MTTEIHGNPGKTPLYREVAAKIDRMIRQGSYLPGERLPSVRELSRRLQVGINTVSQAYAILEDSRVIETRPQSGHYVRNGHPKAESRSDASRTKPELTVNSVTLGRTHMEIIRSLKDERLIPLGLGSPSVDLLPVAKLNRMLAAQLRRSPSVCVSYAASNGLEPLRAQIAKRSLDYGCTLSPDQIVITSGCVEAVTLALQATCRPGDTVVVESPVYYTFLNSVQWMGLKVLEIPSSAQEGMNLDVLRYAIRQHPIHACLLISNFGNPVGGLMPDQKKRELVRLLSKHEIPLIEDDVYGDLGFGRARPPVFKAYDEKGLVLLCSSFSKTLAPGYRVGWIVPGRFQERVEGLKSLLNIATATPTQLAVAEFLAGGGYDRHLRAARRALQHRMTEVRKCVMRYFPSGTRCTRPEGGYLLWIELPEQADAFRLYEDALREEIGVAPGVLFSTSDSFKNCLRLNCSFWSDRIERAIRTLGRFAAAQTRS